MHVLLATTGYPPEHAGAGSRLHQMYRRLAAVHPLFSWSVLTKWRGRDFARPQGPREITAFSRGESEYPSTWEAAAETVWMARNLSAGLLDGVDIVHAAGWTWSTPLLAFAARRKKLPIVRELTTFGDTGVDSLGGRLIRWTNRQASQGIAISPALAQTVSAYLPATTPIWCRPNGVDISRFRLPDAAERGERRARLRQWFPDLTDEDIVVLQVGRIRPLKNQVLLADCVARLPGRFKLLQVGPAYEGDLGYAKSLQRRLAGSDLAGRAVLIEGNSTEIAGFMQGADIVAMPSTSEGLGTVMIEALCCGLPVVASDIPGVTDWVVTAGVNGYLAPLDIVTFAKRLTAAVNLTKHRETIAFAAAKRFNHGAIDDGYWQIFERLSANRRGP